MKPSVEIFFIIIKNTQTKYYLLILDKLLHAVKNVSVQFRVGGEVRHERGEAGRTGYVGV